MDDLLDADAVCRLIGGSHPINPATLYRGIKAGKYPRPIKLSRSLSRWYRREILEALERLVAERDGG